jgi:hypothetical protein
MMQPGLRSNPRSEVLTLFERELPGGRLPPLAAAVAALLLGWALPASTSAATITPESTATCYGSLAPAPTADEPNLLDYKFQCDTRTTAYTILVNRGLSDFDTLDDFSTTASVFQPDGRTPDSSTSWACEGYVPGDSVNCNTGGGSPFMGAWSYSEGSVDPTGPYCKNLPTEAEAGTPAEPRALVQLVVTDYTGAEDGPFRLRYARKCPVVPDRVPVASKSKRTKRQTNVRKGTR